MAAPLNPHEPLLVNTIGHFTGTLVFGVFLYLLVRARARSGRLTLAAAALAFLWNLTSLLVLALGQSNRSAGELLVALGTSALSLLPAVLLQVSLGGRFRALVYSGYAVGGVAVAIHGSEHLLPVRDWHRVALLMTTAGFGALTLLAVALLLRAGGRATTPRLIASMSLFLFSLTLVHTGAAHARPRDVALVVRDIDAGGRRAELARGRYRLLGGALAGVDGALRAAEAKATNGTGKA